MFYFIGTIINKMDVTELIKHPCDTSTYKDNFLRIPIFFRKPVLLSTKKTTIQDQGPLRVSLVVEMKISDHSSIKQVISLDTGSPYLRFQTQVSPAERALQIIY